MNRFPDFDKDVRWPFAVDEQCYDCAEFYHGCNARPSNQPTRCTDYYRLPDVMPGTYGQTFPPSRMQGRKEPRVRRETTESEQQPTPTHARKKPAESRTGPRLCGCGVLLAKGRRLCDQCRPQKRRQTMRQYMRTRRAAPSESQPVSDMPFPHAARPSVLACGGDLPSTGPQQGGTPFQQTTV